MSVLPGAAHGLIRPSAQWEHRSVARPCWLRVDAGGRRHSPRKCAGPTGCSGPLMHRPLWKPSRLCSRHPTALPAVDWAQRAELRRRGIARALDDSSLCLGVSMKKLCGAHIETAGAGSRRTVVGGGPTHEGGSAGQKDIELNTIVYRPVLTPQSIINPATIRPRGMFFKASCAAQADPHNR